MQADFEQALSAKIRNRRLISGCLALIFLALFLVFLFLRESTKEIIVHEHNFPPIPSRTETQYKEAYLLPILLGLFGAAFSLIFLIVDFTRCGFRTIHKDGHDITIWRGIRCNLVYVDGQEKGRLAPITTTNVVEVWLPNRVRVTVSFSHTIWYMAHVFFSDDTSSREV